MSELKFVDTDELKKDDKELSKEIKEDRLALDDAHIKKFCKNNDLAYHCVELNKLDNNIFDIAYVYTGDKRNESNNGNVHHWLLVVGNHLFDSYGKTTKDNSYKLPENIKLFEQKPNQLQSYGTTVCGPYCCLLHKYVKENPNIPENEYAQSFINAFSLTKDTKQNDKIILEEFKENGGNSGKSDEKASE